MARSEQEEVEGPLDVGEIEAGVPAEEDWCSAAEDEVDGRLAPTSSDPGGSGRLDDGCAAAAASSLARDGGHGALPLLLEVSKKKRGCALILALVGLYCFDKLNQHISERSFEVLLGYLNSTICNRLQ